MLNIGVLSYQGSVAEHLLSLKGIKGVRPVPVKYLEDLQTVSGIILPGGESTAIGKLLREFGLFEPLKNRIIAGMPVWGTCAGMILLAQNIVGEQPHLGVMDITVRRNAYGSQLDSFAGKQVIKEISPREIPVVFIRAPIIESVGTKTRILLELDSRIVAAKQDNMLVTSFHPELTKDLSFHRYFANMAEAFERETNKTV